MERSNGGERAESKSRKDKDHDLWYGAGSSAEFRRVPMCCLSHWSGQQCSAEKFHNWGQCPRALEKVGTFEKKVGTLWGK